MTMGSIQDTPPTLREILTPASLVAPLLPIIAGLLAGCYLANAIRLRVRQQATAAPMRTVAPSSTRTTIT